MFLWSYASHQTQPRLVRFSQSLCLNPPSCSITTVYYKIWIYVQKECIMDLKKGNDRRLIGRWRSDHRREDSNPQHSHHNATSSLKEPRFRSWRGLRKYELREWRPQSNCGPWHFLGWLSVTHCGYAEERKTEMVGDRKYNLHRRDHPTGSPIIDTVWNWKILSRYCWKIHSLLGFPAKSFGSSKNLSTGQWQAGEWKPVRCVHSYPYSVFLLNFQYKPIQDI